MAETLTILIVNWNRRDDLARLLEDLSGQTRRPDQIVIVDNGSQDGAAEMVEQHHPDIQLIRLPENLGLSAGRNVGLAECRSDLIAVLDNDLRVLDRTFVEKVIASAAQHTDCGIISFFCVNGLWESPAASLTSPALTMTALVELAARSESPVPRRVFYEWFFWGGASVVRRSVFDRIGVFDEIFRYGGEEWDFAYRCHAAGIRLLRDEGIWVVHVRSPASRSRTASYQILENMVVAQSRYLPGVDLMVFLSLQAAKSLVDAFRSNSLSVLKDTVLRLRSGWAAHVWQRRRPVSKATMRLVYTLRLQPHEDFAAASRVRSTWLSFYFGRLRLHAQRSDEAHTRYVLMP